MVTEKPKLDRMLDNEGFKQRASCVCVRNANENEVMFYFGNLRSRFCTLTPFRCC